MWPFCSKTRTCLHLLKKYLKKCLVFCVVCDTYDSSDFIIRCCISMGWYFLLTGKILHAADKDLKIYF